MLNVSNLATQKSPFLTAVKDNSSSLSVPSLAMASTSSAATTAASVSASSLSSLANQGVAIVNNASTSILKKSPFAPTNINLFPTALYAGASATAPAAADSKTEAQIVADLKSTLSKRFCGNASKINQGLAVYNDPQLKAVVPDARLRASVASLYGTDADGTIAALKSGQFKGVEFADLPVGMNPNTAAFSGTKTGDTKPTIVFNNRYKFEDPRMLGAIMSHEVLHSDTQVTGKEELISKALDATTYAQFVKEDPSLVSKNTELTRTYNAKLMALVNSRDANGKIRILTSGGNVYPGATASLANFGATEPTALSAAATPGNAQLNSYLSKVTGQSVTNASFDNNTLNMLDQKINNAFSAPEWVALAAILRLKVV